MRQDLTEIVFILDRSGSMSSRKNDAEGGMNSFIAAQKELPGEANLTLIQFDDQYETVYKGPLRNAPQFTLIPRGWTALNDAIGRAIEETGTRLREMKEESRPGLVIFVILTDGEENSSREYSTEKIKSMIQHQESKYSWKFTYLGANQDAFAVGGSYGMTSNANYSNTWNAMYAASNNVGRMRRASASGVSANSIKSLYTPDEVLSMVDNKNVDFGNKNGTYADKSNTY